MLSAVGIPVGGVAQPASGNRPRRERGRDSGYAGFALASQSMRPHSRPRSFLNRAQ